MLGTFLALSTGFMHAFEADHVLAVSNIVSVRESIKSSIKDGVLWGLGHSSTIILVGILMMVLRVGLNERHFSYLEASVGLMLISLAALRLRKLFFRKSNVIKSEPHYFSYMVGLMHGLAGSGALVLVLVTQVSSSLEGMIYLLFFGFGATLGMLLASLFLSLPFSKGLVVSPLVRTGFVLTSCSLCLALGGKIIVENLKYA